jgi:hypothetical protein
MSPEAIQSLIEMFGVKKGVQILNLFTAPTEEEEEEKVLPTYRPRLIRSRRRASVRVPARETVNV